MKYKDSELPVDERVADLIKIMTTGEKIAQIQQHIGWEAYKIDSNAVEITDKYKKIISENGVGSFYGILRAGPWEGITLENGLSLIQGAEIINSIQRYNIENSRLGIPILFGEEGGHGHMSIGSTVFPCPIGVASTWNYELVKKMFRTVAKEIRSRGAHVSYSPVLDVARDPRWGRVEETYGEDPYLVSYLGEAIIKGLQGDDLTFEETVVATPKHFVAYGASEGGRNTAYIRVGERTLREIYMKPFEFAIKAGAKSIMPCYNILEGLPVTANKKMLTDVLRGELGFNGYVISDFNSIRLLQDHRIVNEYYEAWAVCLKAGTDVDMCGHVYAEGDFSSALKKGLLTMEDIERAVSRILRIKFQLGLFENPYVEVNEVNKKVAIKEHRVLAKQVAAESCILLKNDGILPLSKKLKTIAVVGPNADNIYNQLGDYTAPQQRKDTITVLDGIRNKLPDVKINYAQGCAIKDPSRNGFDAAIDAVNRSDVTVVVVGGSSAREFKDNACNEFGQANVDEELALKDMETGEGLDRVSLDLMGSQLELVKAIHAVGKPYVVVVIGGRPYSINWISENSKAILYAWYPGWEGGSAIADILFEDYNPCGRLPISIPKSVGQIPVYYSSTDNLSYVEMDDKPLYEFGHGLSFTEFEYSNIKIEKGMISENENTIVSINLKNIGNMAGYEVVQLYIKDDIASIARPSIELKGFKKVYLKPGEVKKIEFTVGSEQLKFIGYEMKYVVECGTFTIMIGGNRHNLLNVALEVRNI